MSNLEEVTVEETREMNEEEMFNNTGLQEDKTTIIMQDDNIYLVLTKEELDESIEDGDLSSMGLALLTKDGGDPELVAFAYGIFELLHTDPELILAASQEFIARKAGFENGTNTLN